MLLLPSRSNSHQSVNYVSVRYPTWRPTFAPVSTVINSFPRLDLEDLGATCTPSLHPQVDAHVQPISGEYPLDFLFLLDYVMHAFGELRSLPRIT